MLKRLHRLICESIFTNEPPLQSDRIAKAFRTLVKLIEATDDTDWSIGESSYASLDSLIVGAYWFYSENYDGQTSDEYLTLCTIGQIFKPGQSSLAIDTPEFEVYSALTQLLGE